MSIVDFCRQTRRVAGSRGALALLAGSLLVGALPLAHASERAATVITSEGTVHLKRADTGKHLIVSPGTAMARGDVINTGRDSSALVRFTDGSELAVRPNTRLAVEDYRYTSEKPEQDSMVLRLLKGGMRQLSGLIGKRGKRDAYRLNAVTATIGIRGTDFTVRLCEEDCQAEQGAAAKAAAKTAAREKPLNNNPRSVAARVVSTSGSTIAVEAGGSARRLSPGAPINAGDVIQTDASGPAVIAFVDQTRVVIDRNSRFQVDAFRYAPDRPEADTLAMRLVKGGMRVLTGLIGKRNPQKVGVRTVTATIGIRGTNFDLVCATGDVGDTANPSPEQLEGAECDKAIYAYTRDGTISVKSGDAPEMLLAKGESGVVPGPGAEPTRLAEVPEALRERAWPAPEGIDIDIDRLFGEETDDSVDPGLYVMVREGTITLATASGETMEFSTGESGRVSPDGGRVFRMPTTPRFLERDPTLADSIVGFGMCRP